MTPEERTELRERINSEVRRRTLGRETRRFCIECGELAGACVCDLSPQDNGSELKWKTGSGWRRPDRLH